MRNRGKTTPATILRPFKPSIGFFFRDTDDFDAAFQSLLDTLKLDLTYFKTHTRYLLRAQEWENKGANPRSELLLRGGELLAAEQWLESSREKDPAPTDAHHTYITASRTAQDAFDAEQRRIAEEVKRLKSVAEHNRITIIQTKAEKQISEFRLDIMTWLFIGMGILLLVSLWMLFLLNFYI